MVPSIWFILYTSKVIKGNALHFSELLGVACSPILSVSFEGMGCEPVLNLSATPDEAASIICTVIDKPIPLTLWGKLMYVSYILLIDQCFSRASCRCYCYNLYLGTLTWLTYAYGMLCQDGIPPREFFTPFICMLWTRHINSCMFMINYWSLYHQAAC
jgi:hypothetical protein